DAEAVAAEVAGLELVAVARVVEQGDAVAVEGGEARLGAGGDGHPLPRDGVAVLEAGGADVVGGDAEPPGDLADEVLGPDAAFLDPEEEVLAGAGEVVRGDFLDLEVFGGGLDDAAGAGQVAGDE